MGSSHPRWPLLAAAIAFLLSAIVAASLIARLEHNALLESRARASNVADDHADALRRGIEQGMSATYALAALVRQGKGTVASFDEVAKEMLPFYPAVSELALAPDGVIRNVVPLAGNEKALGLDLLREPAQRTEALLARNTGKPILAGPLNLVQGGVGLVGRFPVYLDDAAGRPTYWGFTLAVIRFPDIIETVRIAELVNQGYQYELWRIDPDSGGKQVIAASDPSAVLRNPVERTLQVPHGTWTLSVAPANGWGNPARMALEATLGLLFSLLVAYLTKLLLDLRAHRANLEAVVGERTLQLRENEARFRSLTAISTDFYWESDAEHRLTQLVTGNKEDPALILPQGSPLGKQRWEVPYLTPDKTVWEAHRARLDAHLPFRNFEYSRMALDGRVRHVEIGGDPVFDGSGAFQGYRGVGKDISRRKEIEAKVARLTQLYAALSQCNQAIVRCSSEEELFPLICRDAVKFGGMRAARVSLLEQSTRMVRAAASFSQGQDDVPDAEVSYDADSPYGRGPTGTAIREDRAVWCQDFMGDPTTAPWHERGARYGWGAVAALPLHRNGAVVGAFVVFDGEAGAFDQGRRELLLEMAADISFALDNFARESRRRAAEQALRENEARFRSLTEMSSDFYWETDADHRFTLRSEGGKDSSLSLLAHGSPIGRRRWEIESLSPDEPGWRAHRAMMDAHLAFRNFEFSRRGVGGDELHYSVSGDPVLDDTGAFRGYRGVGSNITPRKRHEADLRRLNEELELRVAERTRDLEAANNELEAFSYSVSHDLRAPLRAIQGFSSAVIEQYAGRIDEPGQVMLGRVDAGARRMGQLIDNLLKLSRISRQAMQIEPVDLSALVHEVREELQAAEPERRVEWVIAPRVSAACDTGLLRVLLQNLIGNAWKYSSRRAAARIEFGVDETAGGPVYFVRDNGAGFDMAQVKQLFVAFQRLHAQADFPGTGIGLATVARILGRHGGKGWAEGRVDEGATFYFSLGPTGQDKQ